MTELDNIYVDKAKMYMCEPLLLPKDIWLIQPTVGEIIQFGEKRFYHTIRLFTANPTTYRVQLWDMGIDWNKITDYQLFCMLLQTLDFEVLNLIFPTTDFSKFQIKTITFPDGSISQTLFDSDSKQEIDEDMYEYLVLHVRTMFHIFPKKELARGKITKETIIDDERILITEASHDNSSYLVPLLSGCINHPGFKYNSHQLKEIGIYEFMDSVKRLQVYEITNALLKGRYSGFIDTSKIDEKEFNFMREL